MKYLWFVRSTPRLPLTCSQRHCSILLLKEGSLRRKHVHDLHILFFLNKSIVIYNVVPISAVHQSNPVIYVRVCVCVCIPYIIFHHDLSQEIGQNSLCCTVGLHHLSILNVIVWIYQPQIPVHPIPSPSHSPLATTSLRVCFCPVDRFTCAIFQV